MANGTTQSNFQQQIEKSVGSYANSDDGADITKGALDSQEDYEESEIDDEDIGLEEGDDQEIDTEEPEVTYKKGQVEAIVKTRVNTLQKRINKLEGFKTAVDRMCELTGMDFNKLAHRLENMTIEEQASILGIPVEQVKSSRAAQIEVARERGKTQTLERQLEEQKLKLDPKFSDLDLYKEEIDELIDENPKLSIKQAYLLAKGDTAIDSVARDAEQRAIAKTVNSQKKGVVKPVGGIGKSSGKLSQEVISAAKLVGMDPVDYAKFQGIDNIEAYRASKKK